MMVQRAPGEIYLQSNNHITSSDTFGRIELIDPTSLETIRSSPKLSAGGHTWCGGVVAHANGYLYFNNGDRCYKLDPDCQVVAERKLPQDAAYNSLLILADGCLVMKNIEHDHRRRSSLVILDPERLDQVGPEVEVPENSMGRIAMDTDHIGQVVYVPGNDHFFRYRYANGALRRDMDWSPKYRTLSIDQQTFAWDACLSGGGCWFLDNGDNQANVAIFGTRPFGQMIPERGSVFHGLGSSPQKLFRVDVDDATRMEALVPFGIPRGSIFSPPAFDSTRSIAIAFDTGNGQIGAFRYTSGNFSRLWRHSCRVSMQMVLFPDTGEVAVNDFRDRRDHIVVFDVESGAELGRVATASKTANGMFLSTGWHHDVMYCSVGAIARVWAE